MTDHFETATYAGGMDFLVLVANHSSSLNYLVLDVVVEADAEPSEG